MALGLTQPLKELSTRNIYWGVKSASAYGGQPYHLHVLIVLKSGNLILLEPSGPIQACNGIALPFTFCVWKRRRVYVKQKNDVRDEVKEEVKPELGVIVSAIQKLSFIPSRVSKVIDSGRKLHEWAYCCVRRMCHIHRRQWKMVCLEIYLGNAEHGHVCL
jgi:hypothetical protein